MAARIDKIVISELAATDLPTGMYKKMIPLERDVVFCKWSGFIFSAMLVPRHGADGYPCFRIVSKTWRLAVE